MRIAWLIALAVCACDEHGKGGGPGFLDAPGGGSACGGFGGNQCSPTEFCDFANNTCGAADEGGTCRPRPQGCGGVFQPTCGCDGQVHSNPCDAQGHGADLNANGGCALAPNTFACGAFQCDLSSQFCEMDPRSSADQRFTCKPLPAACAAVRSCSCLAAESCGQFCSGDGTTGLRLGCPG